MTTGNLIIQGNKLKREGKLDEAIALYTQAINLKPDFAFTYYELGDALEKQGNFAQAIIEYEKAIELNPNIDFFHQSLETIKSRKLEQNIDLTSNQINSDFLVVGISMIKNEEDVLETFIPHNLNYLDFLVLADNGSTDNSRKIINKLIQEGLNLCVIDDYKMAHNQTDKMTNLYRRVATSFFPEFIVPIDADELIQSPSKESFINSLSVIPKNGIGIYPWKTYIPEPTNTSHLLSNFKHRRKKENPQYFKIILRTSRSINYQLKIDQGSHGVTSKNGDIPSVELSDICLAHFPIRSVNQLFKKILLGWLGYVDRYKSMDSQGQGYQKRDLYIKIMRGEKFSNSDLTYIALNYAQKVEVKEDCLNHVELEPPTIKSSQLSYSDLIAKNDYRTNVITTIIKSWENQIIKIPPLISREDLIPFSESPTSPSTDNYQHGVFEPNFHLEKLFIDIPPFEYIYQRFLPENILDIGCGVGQYLKIFNKRGVTEIIGVDGFIPQQSFLNSNQYICHDLTHPLNLQRKFDLVMCLEVAEHLPPGKELNLIETLNNHASNILIFSAAEIGQPGNGHINCQPFEYWVDLLKQNWSPMLTETLFFRCISSFSWFRRNPIVLQKKTELTSENSSLKSWDKLIFISQIPYKWYGQKSQIISEILEIDIPDDIYSSSTK